MSDHPSTRTPGTDEGSRPLWREALECAEYALSHPESDQQFALAAVRASLFRWGAAQPETGRPPTDEVASLRRQLQEQIDDKHRILREYEAVLAGRPPQPDASQRLEWVAAALHGDPVFGPGASEPLVRQIHALRALAGRPPGETGASPQQGGEPSDKWDEARALAWLERNVVVSRRLDVQDQLEVIAPSLAMLLNAVGDFPRSASNGGAAPSGQPGNVNFNQSGAPALPGDGPREEPRCICNDGFGMNLSCPTHSVRAAVPPAEAGPTDELKVLQEISYISSGWQTDDARMVALQRIDELVRAALRSVGRDDTAGPAGEER